MKHALRNALIAPFTVIVLQLNWLLSGVVVVEVFFEYDGFGKLLLQAALFGDVYVVQACTLVAVFVAVCRRSSRTSATPSSTRASGSPEERRHGHSSATVPPTPSADGSPDARRAR